MKVNIFIVFLFFVSMGFGSAYAGGMLPHAIYGQILLPDGVTRAETTNIVFDAFVIDRPDEVITEATMGCRINSNGSYVVECSAFPTQWMPAEIVQIEIYDWDFNLISLVQVELNDMGTNRQEIFLYTEELPLESLEGDFLPQALENPAISK